MALALAKVLALGFFLQTDYVADGRKALDAQNYTLAAEQFRKALDANPKDYVARFHLALAESLVGKDDEAIANYRKVLEESPGLYQAELNLGILLLKHQQPADAARLLESAATQKPKEFRPAYYLAEALSETKDWAHSEGFYKTALEVNPKSAAAEVGLARVLVRQNKLADAAPHFHRAAEIDPEYKDAPLELAVVYEAANQRDEAIAIYRQYPDKPAARERLGKLLLDAGQPSDAIPQLEEAVKKSPTAANQLALATAYLKSKQLDKATPLLEQAVAAEPNEVELRLTYGRALRDQRKFADAARQFLRVAQMKPDSLEAWSELASALILLDNYTQALVALDKAHALGGEDQAYYFFRALSLDHLHDLKPALESYRKFLSVCSNPNSDQAFQARQRARIIEKELSRK
jgi:tetratricopeptide (TPR) repeat protein